MIGSYDIEGLNPGSKMNIAATNSITSWEIKLTSESEGFSVGATPVLLESKSMIIDPQESMIIMSAKDWTSVKTTF